MSSVSFKSFENIFSAGICALPNCLAHLNYIGLFVKTRNTQEFGHRKENYVQSLLTHPVAISFRSPSTIFSPFRNFTHFISEEIDWMFRRKKDGDRLTNAHKNVQTYNKMSLVQRQILQKYDFPCTLWAV